LVSINFVDGDLLLFYHNQVLQAGNANTLNNEMEF